MVIFLLQHISIGTSQFLQILISHFWLQTVQVYPFYCCLSISNVIRESFFGFCLFSGSQGQKAGEAAGFKKGCLPVWGFYVCNELIYIYHNLCSWRNDRLSHSAQYSLRLYILNSSYLSPHVPPLIVLLIASSQIQSQIISFIVT